MVESTTNRSGAGRRARQRLCRGLACVGVATLLGACRLLGTGPVGHTSSDAAAVAAAAGWTRIATTNHYLVVANVLPGEEMFTAAERAAEHPVVGESILHGVGDPSVPNRVTSKRTSTTARPGSRSTTSRRRSSCSTAPPVSAPWSHRR